MKLKFILLLLTFSVNVFLFSQNKTSNNKKAESVENIKREKENSFNSKIAEAKAKLGSTEEHGFSTKRSSDGMARPNYEEMGYGEVAEVENWSTLVPPSDMAERARKYEQKKQMETIGLVVLGGILLFFGYKLITNNKKDKKPEVPKDYNEKDYDEVKKKLNDMFSDDLLTKEELEAKLAELEEKQMKEKKAAEISLKKEKLYKAYQEGIITLEEYNAKLNSL
jgi:hypothetical protein